MNDTPPKTPEQQRAETEALRDLSHLLSAQALNLLFKDIDAKLRRDK